jgi:putative ATP-binding cassette transporter
MKIISFLLRLSPGIVVISFLFGIISGASNIGILALTGAALTKDPRFSQTTVRWGFVILCILMPLSRFISEMVLNYLSQTAVMDLRLKMSRRILAAPLRQLELIGIPRLYATLTDDIFAITNALLTLPIVGINAAVVLGCLVYLGWLSFNVLSVVVVFMILGAASYQLLLMRSIKYQRLAREEADSLFKHFRSLTDGTKELKLHRGRHDSFLNGLLRPTAVNLRRFNLKAAAIFTMAGSWGQVLFFILIAFVLFVLPNYDDLPSPAVIGCTLTILYMMTPLNVTLNMLPNMSRASVAFSKVERLGLSLDLHKDQGELPLATDALADWKRLELIGVTHQYASEQPDEIFTLGPIDLEFAPGELVFITGGNGSGKTTLVKLITALYVPEQGEIRLDDEPITNENREVYRQLFSVVFSDFHLFESLLGADSRELDDKARQYLVQLHLEHKVRIKDGGFSTTDLSQGQRKRLALLAAYLEDRAIYVFDEWAADQDPFFKQIFYYELLPALKARGKTVLVISHDDRFYNIADRLIKLDYGKVNDIDNLPIYRQHPIAEMPARS